MKVIILVDYDFKWYLVKYVKATRKAGTHLLPFLKILSFTHNALKWG